MLPAPLQGVALLSYTSKVLEANGTITKDEELIKGERSRFISNTL